jgi:hypothetical protein
MQTLSRSSIFKFTIEKLGKKIVICYDKQDVIRKEFHYEK